MKCFIYGCDSSTDNRSKFRKNGGKSHFFGAPTTEEKLQIWQNAISAAGCQLKQRLLKSKDRICHLHFKHDDILWTHPEYKMPDGKIVAIERGKPELKANAVPSMFPKKKKLEYAHFLGKMKLPDNGELPQGESNKILEEPSPVCTLSLHGSNESSSEVNGDANYFIKNNTSFEAQTTSTVSSEEEFEKPNVEERVKFDTICEELSRDPNCVPLPHSGIWMLNVVNTPVLQCVMWSLWSKDISKVRKQILFYPDMSIAVRVDGKQVNVPELRKAETINDLRKIVSAIDQNIVPCRKATNTLRALNCSRYAWKNKVRPGPQTWRCEHCCKLRKSTLRKVESADKVKSIRNARDTRIRYCNILR